MTTDEAKRIVKVKYPVWIERDKITDYDFYTVQANRGVRGIISIGSGPSESAAWLTAAEAVKREEDKL